MPRGWASAARATTSGRRARPSQRALTDAWLTERIRRDPQGAPRRLRGAADPRRSAPGARHPGLAQARGAADASGRHLGAGAPQARPHHDPVPGVRVADDLVERQFRPGAPNVLWIADVTYLRTWEGWLYLAAVQDAYSPPDRRLEHGRPHARRARRRRARDGRRRRRPAPGLIHHSDQGSQGGFQGSSQRSIGRLRWVGRFGRGSVRVGRRCVHRGDRRSVDASIASGSGRRSRGACAATLPASRRASHPSWASGGFGRLAACRRSVRLRCPGGTCRSPSARRSQCCGPAAAGCARSPAGSAGRLRRSRASCGATRRRVAAGWTIARQRRSGMPIYAPSAPSRRS